MLRALMWPATVALASVALLLTTAVPSSAQVTGTPTVYKVTLQSVAFSQSDDGVSGFVTVSSSSLVLDIASAAAGATLGNYITGVSLAAGTYRRMQIVVSCTFKLKGQLTSLGTTYWTTAGGTSSSATASDAAPTEGSFTIPASSCPAGTITGTSPSGAVVFTISPNTPVTVAASFDVTNAMQLVGGTLFPGSPSMTFTVVQ